VRSEDRHVAIDRQEAARIATAFFAASRSGNVSALRELLAEGAIFHSDGGGHRYAARNIIAGAARILRFFAGIADKARAAGLPRPPCRLARINGLPGIVSLEPDGMVQTTALRIENGLITAIYVVRNPDKLKTVAEIALLPAAV
jgi:RNA polymerase sigma-70 factor (ECF subfamily)